MNQSTFGLVRWLDSRGIAGSVGDTTKEGTLGRQNLSVPTGKRLAPTSEHPRSRAVLRNTAMPLLVLIWASRRGLRQLCRIRAPPIPLLGSLLPYVSRPILQLSIQQFACGESAPVQTPQHRKSDA